MPPLPAIPNAKDLWELVKAGATIEAQEKIIELRQAALDLQDENIQLRERVRELEHQLEHPALHWDGKFYWLQPNGTPPEHGPFCPRCADGEKKQVRLQDRRQGWDFSHWFCVVRNKQYPP